MNCLACLPMLASLRYKLAMAAALAGLLASACSPGRIDAGQPMVTETETVRPSPTALETVEVVVYFTDSNRYAAGQPPFEVPVVRSIAADSFAPLAILNAFFEGPTEGERAQGLDAITSGFSGVHELKIQDDVAHVWLSGQCQSMGATYTVAQPAMRNLLQFEEIQYVKIYDERG